VFALERPLQARVKAKNSSFPVGRQAAIFKSFTHKFCPRPLKKRFGLSASLYTILQILSLTLFEKTPIFTGPFSITTTNGHA
jgi:hypothetical protein